MLLEYLKLHVHVPTYGGNTEAFIPKTLLLRHYLSICFAFDALTLLNILTYLLEQILKMRRQP